MTTSPTDASSVRIHVANLDDPSELDAVRDLLAAFHREEDGHDTPWSVRDGLGSHLRRRADLVLLASRDDVAVGVLIAQRTLASFTALDSCNIHDVFVAEEARGTGVARRLMAACEAHARARGCGKITLEVNADNLGARALYRSLGFDVPEETGPSGSTFFARKPLD